MQNHFVLAYNKYSQVFIANEQKNVMVRLPMATHITQATDKILVKQFSIKIK